MLSLNKSRAEVPVIGMKNVYSFKRLSDAEELYSVYFRMPLVALLKSNVASHGNTGLISADLICKRAMYMSPLVSQHFS